MLKNKVIISIVVATYNSENTIRCLIQSILRQEYDYYELIIVDGCSTDSTIDIIKEYEDAFSGSLKYISESDSGIYDAWNKGVSISSGSYILFLGADDYFVDNALSKMHNVLIENINNNVIIAAEIQFKEKNDKVYDLKISDKLIEYKIRRYIMPVRQMATFYPKKIYDEIGFYDINYKIVGDYDFVYRAIFNGYVIKAVAIIIGVMSTGGMSNNNALFDVKMKEFIYFYRKHKKHVSNFRYIRYCVRMYVSFAIKKKMPILVSVYRNFF